MYAWQSVGFHFNTFTVEGKKNFEAAWWLANSNTKPEKVGQPPVTSRAGFYSNCTCEYIHSSYLHPLPLLHSLILVKTKTHNFWCNLLNIKWSIKGLVLLKMLSTSKNLFTIESHWNNVHVKLRGHFHNGSNLQGFFITYSDVEIATNVDIH